MSCDFQLHVVGQGVLLVSVPPATGSQASLSAHSILQKHRIPIWYAPHILGRVGFCSSDDLRNVSPAVHGTGVEQHGATADQAEREGHLGACTGSGYRQHSSTKCRQYTGSSCDPLPSPASTQTQRG